ADRVTTYTMPTEARARLAELEAGQLLRREFTGRAAGVQLELRSVEGIGVPYGVEVEIFPGYFETFERGAVEPPEGDSTKVFWRHHHPIGLVLEAEHTEAGWQLKRTRISDTPQGNEALTLAADEVITQWSVGFRPLEWTKREDED